MKKRKDQVDSNLEKLDVKSKKRREKNEIIVGKLGNRKEKGIDRAKRTNYVRNAKGNKRDYIR